jgi:hypothetical protein
MKTIKCDCGRDVRVDDKCVSVLCYVCLNGGTDEREDEDEREDARPHVEELLRAS